MSSARQTHIRRLSSALASIVLGTLAVFALLLVVLGVVARPGHDGISRVAGHPILTVLSGSMVPVFRPGDLAIDQAVTASQASHLAAGDIITFHVPGSATQLITHKIVAVKVSPGHGLSPTQVNYETRGVANNAPDPDLVSPNQIVGTYSWRVPFGGYFLQAVQKKVVFFFLILLPLLYLIGSEITKRWKEPEPQTTKSERNESAEAAGTPDAVLTPGLDRSWADDSLTEWSAMAQAISSADQAVPKPSAESAVEQPGLRGQPIRGELATWDWDRPDRPVSTSAEIDSVDTVPALAQVAETATGKGGHAST